MSWQVTLIPNSTLFACAGVRGPLRGLKFATYIVFLHVAGAFAMRGNDAASRRKDSSLVSSLPNCRGLLLSERISCSLSKY